MAKLKRLNSSKKNPTNLKKEISRRFNALDKGYGRWIHQSGFAECEGITAGEILSFYAPQLAARAVFCSVSSIVGKKRRSTPLKNQICGKCGHYTLLSMLEEDAASRLICRPCRHMIEKTTKRDVPRGQPMLF